MYSIGKFASLCGLSIKNLRTLDRTGVLRPAVVDPKSGYRYYHSSQLGRAEWVAQLKACGLTPDEIWQVLSFDVHDTRSGDTEALQAIFERSERECRTRLQQIGSAKRKLIDAGRIQEPGSAVSIEVKSIPACDLCISRRFGDYAEIDVMIHELREFLHSSGLTETGAPMLLWGDLFEIDQEPQIEVALPYRGRADGVPELYLRRLPAGEVACLVSARPRDALGLDYESLFDWCFSNEYLIVGPIRALFRQDPVPGSPVAPLTELQVPVARADRLPVPDRNPQNL